jgi:adenylate kinase family enzyme
VINLKLREEALLAKCIGRRKCSQCGGNFNVASIDIEGENGAPRMYMPPLLPPPECESKLITRADDTEEVVKERLRVYHDLVCTREYSYFLSSEQSILTSMLCVAVQMQMRSISEFSHILRKKVDA